VDVGTWTTLSRLIDEALDLPPAARTTWLESLSAEYEAFKPRLREMLNQAAATGDAAFLATLPKIRDASISGEPFPALGPDRTGSFVGPYRLIRELASGGQGSVWLADRPDGLVNRRVAIKLPVGLGYRPDLAERLARERQILAALTHPNIARLYDAGLTGAGEPYLALEYVEGVSIDRYCSAHRLDVDARLHLILQVMRAVTYAHGQLVIHRDLKPSNVLVTPDGDVRLLDFGIARLLDDSPAADLTVTGGRAMTLPYASPEQVAHLPLGVATDVYSLGVMVYELLAGQRPYRPARETAAALEEAILSQDPLRPSEAATDAATRKRLRGDLDAVVLKALNKEPEQRYPSVSAFADDIERYLDGRPVYARPADWFSRARKFVGRNRLAVGASAAVIVAVLGGAGVAIWQARVAQAEQRRAEAVKDFIASIFKDVDPNLRGRDRPLTALDVLDLARERVDRELADEPEARIELRRILGDSLLGVTAYDKGAEVLRAATAESERVFGPDAPGTIETRLLLAAALQYDADPKAAYETIDGVVSSLRRTNQLESEAFVRASLMRVSVALNHGQAAAPETETSALEALAAAERLLPAGHRMRAEAFDSLATICRVRGKAAQGFEYAEKAYLAALAAYGQDPKHPRVIASQNVYGQALFEVDRTAEAVKHMKEAAANGADVYRENGLYVQHLLGTLANIQQAYGEIGEALTNLQKASEADIGGVRLAPSYVAGQHAALARVLLAARRYSDADREYQLALDGLRKTPDANIVRVFEVEHAATLVGLGRDGEARAIVEPLVTDAPPRGQTDRHALAVLARIERRAGRLDRAASLADRADDSAPARPRIRALVADARLLKALVQLDRGQLDEARATLDAAESMRRSLEGVLTPIGADILVARGRVELAAGRPAEAVPYLEQADGFWRGFDPTHPDSREAASWLSRARAAR